MAAPRVFLSYSHDTLAHMERVRALSDRLRLHGVEAIVDRYYEDTLDMRWTDWMAQQVEAADFVLVVATAGYLERLKPGPGAGAGSHWEGALVTQQLYELHGMNTKFFAVYFDAEDAKSIPLHLRGYTNYHVGTDEGYAKLYRRVTRQPDAVPPPVGAVVDPNRLLAPPPLPPAESLREDVVKVRLDELARAYQALRTSMLPGNARTRKMEVVAAKMRALACDGYYLLDYLARNPEPGARLAAVSLLEARPSAGHLEWLAERLAPEKPFVGYHAALALFTAARTLEPEHRDRVRAAIHRARTLLGAGLDTTDRAQALDAALHELDESAAVGVELGLTERGLPPPARR